MITPNILNKQFGKLTVTSKNDMSLQEFKSWVDSVYAKKEDWTRIPL